MFWQLDLAFGKGFYQRLGDRYRTLAVAEWPKNDDEKKQRFLLETSRVAGINLKSFFHKWGIKPTKETSAQLKAMNLPDLREPIWENRDSNIAYSYSLTQQNITGNVRLPDTVNAGDVFTVTVEVANRNTSALTYQWDIPKGFEIITDNGREITLRAPHNVLQNAMLPIPVTVTDSNNMAMRLASSTQLKTVGENISTRAAYDQRIKQRYQIEGDLNHWKSGSHRNTRGTVYLYDNHYTGTRDYFRLKKSSYGLFPTNQTSNKYWEYLESYDGSQYLNDDVIKQTTANISAERTEEK
ncbi:TPA: M60 family metallopeptidase [Yersinia enterocolitica]